MDLVKLPFVKGFTARMIHNAVSRFNWMPLIDTLVHIHLTSTYYPIQGLRSIAAIAAAEPSDLIPILEAVSLCTRDLDAT